METKNLRNSESECDASSSVDVDQNKNCEADMSRLTLREEIKNFINSELISQDNPQPPLLDVNKNRSSSLNSSSEKLHSEKPRKPSKFDSNANSRRSSTITDNVCRSQPSSFQIPIIGYEVMEERARFTIFKLRIDDPRTGLSWMVFRRYTDFVRLYNKLKETYPKLYLPMPGKRIFKDNFEPGFLDERVRGLQIFINVVVKNLPADLLVRDFFCLDEPPPICDSEPESQALFNALEDTVISLKNQLRQKDETIDYLKKKMSYFEDKMKNCEYCNPWYKHSDNSPGTSGSSNCS